MGNNLISYWRTSLIDTERSKLDHYRIFNDDTSISIHSAELNTGKVIKEFTPILLNDRSKGSVNNNIPVLIYPFIYKLESAAEMPGDYIIPLCVPALLNKNGILIPPPDALPWIPRQHLTPIENGTHTICDVDDVDRYYDTSEYCGISWSEYLAYGFGLLSCVADKNQAFEFETIIADAGTYRRESMARIILDTTEQQGMCKHLVSLYDSILSKEISTMPLLGLFSNLLVANNEVREYKNASQLHFGHMHPEFTLSDSQRKALHVSALLEDGGLQVIKGPPGTGKTTLIQSIVANEWTKAALEGRTHPPVTFITSTNNQAVTNVIDRFNDSLENGGSVVDRWLPDVDTFGLYCGSIGKKTDVDRSKYMTHLSLSEKTECIEYYTEASQYFLDKASQYFGIKFKTIDETKGFIHKRMGYHTESLNIFKHYNQYNSNKPAPSLKSNSANNMSSTALIAQQDADYKYYKQVATMLPEWNKQQQSVHPIIAFLSFIPFIANVRRQLASDCLGQILEPVLASMPQEEQRCVSDVRLKIRTTNINPSEVNNLVTSLLKKITSTAEDKLASITQQIHSREIGSSLFDEARKTIENHVNNTGLTVPEYDYKADTGIRYLLFGLASHYWEASWLEEVESLLRTKKLPIKGKGYEQIASMWRRYSKITPLMVSTLHMLPKHLCAWKAETGGFVSEPLLNYVDLLIIDEAGQVAPEIAPPSMALSKKAIIIGDPLQIEPVQPLPKSIDRANMKRHCPDYSLKYNLMGVADKGVASASGSAIHIASRTTTTHLVTLKEHRRCVPEIIDYCNKLAYGGELFSFRQSKVNRIYNPFQWVKTFGTKAVKSGGSWSNKIEAEEIAKWLFENTGKIKQHYGESITKTVGIITPFAKQAAIIKKQLVDQGIPRVTVGTIHSFQGSERDIIIFSPVYTSDCGGTPFFFDLSPNMLNVAVSRAKDTFIVIGDPNIFKKGNTPSGLLAGYLLKTEQDLDAG